MTETALDSATIWPEDYGLPQNHCADVIAGSYDVPFDPETPPVIIDIGANVGAFVRWAVKRWPGCTVHAYEPQPENFRLLVLTTTDIVDRGSSLIVNRNVGVFDKTGKAQLHFNGLNCGEWSLLPVGDKVPPVEVETIDALTLPKADILKIDAEGSEWVILKRLESRLTEFSAIMLECHGEPIVEPIKTLLLNHGFALTGEKIHAKHRVELKFVKANLLPKTVEPIATPLIEVTPNPLRPGEPPRKIIFATPFKGGASVNYIRFLVKSMRAKFPGKEIDYIVSDSGSVAFARNEITWHAENERADAVVMVDEDMMAEPHHGERLMSHAEAVVAGIYCRRNAGTPFWLFVPKKGAEIRPDGLLESVRLPTGFMMIRTEVFAKFREVFPERLFESRDTASEPLTERIEAFPSGLIGPGTAEGRIETVREILYGWDITNPSLESLHHVRDHLITAVSGKRGPNRLMGEDYYFSRMARKAGFNIYADTRLVIGHIGNISYPVTPEMVGIGPDKGFHMPMAEDE